MLVFKKKYCDSPDCSEEDLSALLRTGYLSFDECQLAPEPAFNSKSGEVAGLVQYGGTTLHIERPSTTEPELASHSLVLMFTSCCTEVAFPVAQFHPWNLTAERLLVILKQVVCALADCGLDLVNLNADGYARLMHLDPLFFGIDSPFPSSAPQPTDRLPSLSMVVPWAKTLAQLPAAISTQLQRAHIRRIFGAASPSLLHARPTTRYAQICY